VHGAGEGTAGKAGLRHDVVFLISRTERPVAEEVLDTSYVHRVALGRASFCLTYTIGPKSIGLKRRLHSTRVR
jgi:hypothetical protein